MDERRKSPRFDVTQEVQGNIKPTMAVRIVNISIHGMLIETPFGLPPSGVCELTVNAPSGPILITARVARCRANMVKGKDGKASIRFHAGLEFPEEFANSPQLKALMTEVCTLSAPTELELKEAPVNEIEQAM